METNMYDKEFAKYFEVDIEHPQMELPEDAELDEMKWEAGVVYHQEFKNGDKVYFRADSVQKNKRWKGLSVDEFGGRQKKAKNASADEKQQGWVTTPKNEIPKGLKEEVEITEVLKSKDKSVIDAFYDKDSLVGRLLSTNGRSLQKHGMGGQTIAAWLKGKIAIVAVSDVKSTESILRYMKNSIPKLNFDPKSYKKFFEEVEIEEKRSATGYELYHKDFSSAMQHAYKFAKSKGHVIDPKEIDDKVATGPKKPSSGKTNRYSLKAGRKRVEIQVANLDNKRYELNMYIEGKDVKNPLNKIKEALTRMRERSMAEKPENKSSIEEQDDYYAPWLDAEAQEVQHKWKRMNTKLRVKWLTRIKKMADKEGMSQEVLNKILDHYGLTKFPKEKVWHEVQKIKPKWKRMSTAERTRWIDDLDDIAKKTHTSHADVEAILDDAKLKIKEEVEMDEGTSLQVKMALSDVGLKGTWKNGKVYVKKRDVKKAEKALKGNVIYRGKPPVVVGENFFNKIREVIDLKKSSMGTVIKDFQDSDAPQFKGKSDKKRREMAIAAKLAADQNESVKEDEKDDPKSKKKDKINLKPKMDEKMAKTYKEMLKYIKKEKKPTEEVKEAVTDGGIEYGEQDWDAHYRLDHAYPNLGVNYAEFHEQELEGPYQIDGAAYFFDRKVGSWYSVESEDYVDDEKSKELSFRYVKDGMYKPQFSN
jgi:predicted DNA binding CopG/RHH family protein